MVKMGDLKSRNEEVARDFIRWYYVPTTPYRVPRGLQTDEVYDLFFGAGGRMGRVQKGRWGNWGKKLVSVVHEYYEATVNWLTCSRKN